MNTIKIGNSVTAFPFTSDERREAAEREERDRADARQKAFTALTSPRYTPTQRIRLWEQLHGLHMPLVEEHRLIGVISKRTELSLEQVRAEQHRRINESKPSTTEASS